MTDRIERVISSFSLGEQPKQVHHWRTRPVAERLAETFRLHREGNDIFRGGNRPFTYTFEPFDVDAAR